MIITPFVRSETYAEPRAARRSVTRLPFALRRASLLAAALALPLAACGSDDDGSDESAAGGSGGGSSNTAGSASGGANGGTAGMPATGVGTCNAVTVDSPPTSAQHVTQCSALSFSTNPPSGGPHYDNWAAFQTYDFALAAGHLVHNLEHGGVVFWYNCPEGCVDEVADVQALIEGLPVDPLCAGTGVDRRAILVPHPELDTRWGVSAWGAALSADCVDSEAFITFYVQHYARGPEQLCNAGVPYTADPCE